MHGEGQLSIWKEESERGTNSLLSKDGDRDHKIEQARNENSQTVKHRGRDKLAYGKKERAESPTSCEHR